MTLIKSQRRSPVATIGTRSNGAACRIGLVANQIAKEKSDPDDADNVDNANNKIIIDLGLGKNKQQYVFDEGSTTRSRLSLIHKYGDFVKEYSPEKPEKALVW
ncbi:hypothetical protein E4U14_003682 [Claviceps sp. LM454 group G7]|nr:hypothetical protein E4U14_003682 [Claviceps sp. LM454 group G7]